MSANNTIDYSKLTFLPIDRVKTHFTDTLDYANMVIEQRAMESRQLREIIDQLSTNYIAATKDGDSMSDGISEKVSSLEARMSIIETDIKHMSNSMNRIETKLDKVLDKFDTVVTKEGLKEKLDTMKWTISVVVSLVAIIAAVLARFIKV